VANQVNFFAAQFCFMLARTVTGETQV
jgi:hypothetical protein